MSSLLALFPGSDPDLNPRLGGLDYIGMWVHLELTWQTLLAAGWQDAKTRVLKSYREWLRAVSLTPLPGFNGSIGRSDIPGCLCPRHQQEISRLQNIQLN